jgi:hypothetical protein
MPRHVSPVRIIAAVALVLLAAGLGQTRPLEALAVVVNGQVRTAIAGDGQKRELRLAFQVPITESVWVAARVRGRQLANEPAIQAHTSPVYVLRDRQPAFIKAARESVAARWRRELDYYRGPELTFADPEQRRELEARLEQTTRILEREPEPWP